MKSIKKGIILTAFFISASNIVIAGLANKPMPPTALQYPFLQGVTSELKMTAPSPGE